MEQQVESRAKSLPVPAAIDPITDREFQRFRDLIESHAGINLTVNKKALLVGRLLRRLRATGVGSFNQYYETVIEDKAEFLEMLDCICTNETRFFREPKQFELLASSIFPGWRRQRSERLRSGNIRVWSAGCSTGEEPFTIAMMLAWHLPVREGWYHDIVASDISTRVLRASQEATWNAERAQDIPSPFLRRFMTRGTGANQGKMRASDELRPLIRFTRVNLNTVEYPSMGRFDAIFCRNVLIYFDRELRSRVTAGLISCLSPGGYLFLGHAEALLAQHADLRVVVPSVFQKGGATHA